MRNYIEKLCLFCVNNKFIKVYNTISIVRISIFANSISQVNTFLLFLMVCPITASGTLLPDSLLTREHIYEYTFSDTAKAARIIDLMRERRLAPEHVLDIAEGDLLFNNGRYNAALPFYKSALASDSIRNNDAEYMEQLHRLISCYDCLHDEARKADCVERLQEKAKACGSKAMQSVALFNMGKMAYYQEDKEKGYELIGEAVALMEDTDYKYKYDNLRYDYNTLFIMQQRDRRLEDALHTLERLEKVVMASTAEEPEIRELNEKELKTLYANRAVLFSRLGRTGEADKSYRQWKETATSYTKDDYLIAPYLSDRQMHSEVIRIYSDREFFLRANNDTVNYHMRTVKRSLGQAYEAIHDYASSSRYFKELAVLVDSLKVREQQSAALELATAYENYKLKEEASKQATHVKIRNAWLTGCGLALLVLLALFIRKEQYARIIRRKNEAMVNTIRELMAYRDRLYKLLEEQEARNIPHKTKCGVAPAEDEQRKICPQTSEEEKVSKTMAAKTASDKEAEENCLLFQQLDRIVTSKMLFTQQDLLRDKLTKHIGVDKNRFARILQQNGQENMSTYLNNKRMEYAMEILKKHPTYNIATVAKMCGISISTLNRTFKNKYMMTPSDFRDSLQNINNQQQRTE